MSGEREMGAEAVAWGFYVYDQGVDKLQVYTDKELAEFMERQLQGKGLIPLGHISDPTKAPSREEVADVIREWTFADEFDRVGGIMTAADAIITLFKGGEQ